MENFHTPRSGFRNTSFLKDLGRNILNLWYWIAQSQHAEFFESIQNKKVEFYAIRENLWKLVTYSGFSFVEITEYLLSLDNIES